MKLPVFTRATLSLDEYLIGLDKEELEQLSVIPSVRSARKTLYTIQGSKFIDIWALYVDSLPLDIDDEFLFDDEDGIDD
ncbi:hypothetical protein [Nostoc sp. 'Peltigera membranacea cyanobiont' N6]|uniref:hypothetical protein n=1 Tax=Nostoc sp. 'Peltigera membranacea cyanobiont' N6 TaxID=1261031 RepID=UPI000CF3437D|nr:hypothetical protein [Nostoc sp. 'Peltigera membranacea cyanobiont' N6]AVH65597.1 hypothetical protein NPM_4041 [Nostoc sp. 'Peltigera membranacea cyanobiont' N6]